MRTAVTLALIVACLLATAPAAGAAGYATDSDGTLYQVVPDEPTIERIGPVEVVIERADGTKQTVRPSLTDLAISDLHGLYGISFDALYRINPHEPSKSMRVGPLRRRGYSQFNALAFDDRGRLFALEGGTLCQIDIKTGLARDLGSLGGNWSSDGDLAWFGGSLYATVNGGSGSACHLVRIDMKTWKAIPIGPIRLATRRAGKADPEKKDPDKTAPGKSDAGKAAKKKDGASPTRDEKGDAKGDAKKDARPRASAIVTFPDVWGLIWDGRDLYGVTPRGELIRIDDTTGRAVVVTKVRARFYGSCAMLRI